MSDDLRRALRAGLGSMLVLSLSLLLIWPAQEAHGFDLFMKIKKHNKINKYYNIQSLKLREGDVIFHKSKSSQSEAIRIATRSRFNHVAILLKYGDALVALEAVQPVKLTPVEQFIARGGGHFVVKRLRDHEAVLTSAVLTRMKELGNGYLGKPYDIYFRWDEERIYCSELVWKLYKQSAGIEIGRLQNISELNLDHRVVQRLIDKRYGRQAVLPQNEPIISPQSIYESERLVTVHTQ